MRRLLPGAGRRALKALRRCSDRSLSEMTPRELLREWRLAGHLREVEFLFSEDDDKTTNKISDRARRRRHAIEAELGERSRLTRDDSDRLQEADDFFAVFAFIREWLEYEAEFLDQGGTPMAPLHDALWLLETSLRRLDAGPFVLKGRAAA